MSCRETAARLLCVRVTRGGSVYTVCFSLNIVVCHECRFTDLLCILRWFFFVIFILRDIWKHMGIYTKQENFANVHCKDILRSEVSVFGHTTLSSYNVWEIERKSCRTSVVRAITCKCCWPSALDANETGVGKKDWNPRRENPQVSKSKPKKQSFTFTRTIIIGNSCSCVCFLLTFQGQDILNAQVPHFERCCGCSRSTIS